MKAMIFAAGLGTRLKPFTDKHPKALAEVNGKPLLQHAITYLQGYGIKDVVVNVHHFADQIENALNDNNGYGSNVTVSDERDAVLETGGGLKKAVPYFEGEENIVVMNVDVLTTLNLQYMLDMHRQSDAVATLAVMKRNSSRYLLFDGQMMLWGWKNEKTGEVKTARESKETSPFAFTGIQIINQKLLNNIPFDGKFSLIDLYLHFARTETIKGFDHTGDTFLDVGKPETLEQAGSMFK